MGLQDGLESAWNNLTGQTAADAAAAERAAQAQKIAQMQQAAGVYGDYRQQAQQARMNALSNISTAYQPANNALATLYGGGTGQVPFAARPAGYAPITAGGANAQSAWRPMPIAPGAPQQVYPALQDARNPPGSTIPIARPTGPLPMPTQSPQPAVAPPPGAMAAAQPPDRVQAPAGGAQGVMAGMLALNQGGASMRTLAGPAPNLASGVRGAIQGGAATPNQPVAARPTVPQGAPRSEVPPLPGMNGAPSGSTGSVNGGSAMGLQPGAQASGSAPPAARPPAAPQVATGAAGVSFQPGQMMSNPFNSGPPGGGVRTLSMPAAFPVPAPARPAIIPATSISREDIWKGLTDAKQPPGVKNTAPLLTASTAMDTIRRLGGVNALKGANFGA